MTTNDKVFRLPSTLLQRQVKVLLIGAGGNGSQILPGLARLHHAMTALGHPAGLSVLVVDGDTVSESNVGRQIFYRSDIGLSKAVVLTHRVNTCYGLNWNAHFGFFGPEHFKSVSQFDVIVGCVDTRKARRHIHQALWKKNWSKTLWLDLGNDAFSGQVVLGQSPVNGSEDDPLRPPLVTEFYPDILNADGDAAAEKNAGPSCSLAEALQKQATFVNQMCGVHALNMLSNLFRFGLIDHSAVFFDTKSGRSSALPVDPAAWQRFGISRPSQPLAA